MDLRGHVRMMFTLGIRRSQVTVELCASMTLTHLRNYPAVMARDDLELNAPAYVAFASLLSVP